MPLCASLCLSVSLQSSELFTEIDQQETRSRAWALNYYRAGLSLSLSLALSLNYTIAQVEMTPRIKPILPAITAIISRSVVSLSHSLSRARYQYAYGILE